MNNISILIAYILSLVYFSQVDAATIYAITNSVTDVQSAINSASNGDTVVIPTVPTNNPTWTSTVTVNKGITLTGQGFYSVNSNHLDTGTWPLRITGSGGIIAIDVNSSTGNLVRITGIHFSGSFGGGWGTGGGGAIRVNNSNSTPWRIDNCKFSSFTGLAITVKNSYGLIDHIYVDNGTNNTGSNIHISRYGPSGRGNESWTDDVGFGSANFVFIENSTFYRSCTAANGAPAALDAQGAGRYVIRYSYVRDNPILCHGTESGGYERSGYAFEVYNNTLVWSLPSWRFPSPLTARGGTWLIHNNTIREYNYIWRTWIGRRDDQHAVPPYGWCDGTKNWDGNTSPAGYPCLDQPGRGKAASSDPLVSPYGQPQASSPCRLWNNTWSQIGGNCVGTPRNNGATCHRDADYVVEGRDYYYSTDNSAALPGYTPYTYPHPLRNTGPQPPQKPRIEPVN